VNPIQVPPDGGSKVNVLGSPMAIRLHGRDTGGVVSAVESREAICDLRFTSDWQLGGSMREGSLRRGLSLPARVMSWSKFENIENLENAK